MPASAAILTQSSWQELPQGRISIPAHPPRGEKGKLHTTPGTTAGPLSWAGTALMPHALLSPAALKGAAHAAKFPHPFQEQAPGKDTG